MIWYVISVLTSLIFDVFRLTRMDPDEKDAVFIEIGTRRIHITGFTSNPNGQWVSQQARQPLW
jgi:hypothetical protein